MESKEPISYDEVYWTAIVNQLKNATAVRNEPKWAPDSYSPNCMLCSKKFSLFFRKHHCRKCGKCVCNECAPSNNSRPIKEWGYSEPVRHCYECFKSPSIKFVKDSK